MIKWRNWNRHLFYLLLLYKLHDWLRNELMLDNLHYNILLCNRNYLSLVIISHFFSSCYTIIKSRVFDKSGKTKGLLIYRIFYYFIFTKIKLVLVLSVIIVILLPSTSCQFEVWTHRLLASFKKSHWSFANYTSKSKSVPWFKEHGLQR